MKSIEIIRIFMSYIMLPCKIELVNVNDCGYQQGQW